MKKVSVSSVLFKMMNKPALMYWAVNCTINSMAEKLNKLRDTLPEEVNLEKIIAKIEAFLPEAKKASKAIGDKAKEIGKDVHTEIENIVSGSSSFDGAIENALTPEAGNCLTAFKSFCVDYNIVPWEDTVDFEKAVSKEAYDFLLRGRLDWKVIIADGEEPESLDRQYIIDIKTSSAIYDEAGLQLGAYLELDEDDGNRIAILRLDKKTGKYEFKEFDSIYRDKFNRLFDAYAAIYG